MGYDGLSNDQGMRAPRAEWTCFENWLLCTLPCAARGAGQSQFVKDIRGAALRVLARALCDTLNGQSARLRVLVPTTFRDLALRSPSLSPLLCAPHLPFLQVNTDN